jgi:hypothetical protein
MTKPQDCTGGNLPHASIRTMQEALMQGGMLLALNSITHDTSNATRMSMRHGAR